MPIILAEDHLDIPFLQQQSTVSNMVGTGRHAVFGKTSYGSCVTKNAREFAKFERFADQYTDKIVKEHDYKISQYTFGEWGE